MIFTTTIIITSTQTGNRRSGRLTWHFIFLFLSRLCLFVYCTYQFALNPHLKLRQSVWSSIRIYIIIMNDYLFKNECIAPVLYLCVKAVATFSLWRRRERESSCLPYRQTLERLWCGPRRKRRKKKEEKKLSSRVSCLRACMWYYVFFLLIGAFIFLPLLLLLTHRLEPFFFYGRFLKAMIFLGAFFLYSKSDNMFSPSSSVCVLCCFPLCSAG